MLSNGTNLINGNIDNWHYYGIINAMYDPMDKMTMGLEFDYGVKRFDYEGYVNDSFVSESKQRDAMRISFGIMYEF